MSDFKPMLAKDAVPAKLKFPLAVQKKFDGIRVVIKDGKALTRTLKEVPNREVFNFLSDPRFEGLDGEILVGDPTDEDAYRTTVSFVMAPDKTGEDWHFHVFDYHNRSTNTFRERYTALLHAVHDLNLYPDPKITMVETFDVISALELESTEERIIAEGYEGAIIRGWDTLYKYGRSSPTKGECLKLKRYKDAEAEIVGVYEEMHNGNEAVTNALGRTERSSVKANKSGKGTLGGLEVRAINGDFEGVQFRVGTGFSAALKQELWDQKHHLPGLIIKFKYFPVGTKDKPRHPVFLGFRNMEIDG